MSWQWDTSVYRTGDKIAGFSQSSLRISKEELVVGKQNFKPVLTQRGEIRRRVLDLCDGKRSMTEISELVQKEYPEKYKSLDEAFREVVGVVRPVVKLQ
jgi:hypothetical protein